MASCQSDMLGRIQLYQERQHAAANQRVYAINRRQTHTRLSGSATLIVCSRTSVGVSFRVESNFLITVVSLLSACRLAGVSTLQEPVTRLSPAVGCRRGKIMARK